MPMKLIYTIFFCLLLFLKQGEVHAQDLIYLKGKELPLKGTILEKGKDFLGDGEKLSFVRENTRKPKTLKMDKIGVVFTEEKQLFIDPANANRIRDFSAYDYGIIFLSNGTSIAIKNWEVIGSDGRIEYENHFTADFAELAPDEFVAILSQEADLRLFGDHKLAYNRLKNSFLPKVPKIDQEDVLATSQQK